MTQRILVVCRTYDSAKIHFHRTAKDFKDIVDRCSLAEMTIDIGDIQYKFISDASPDRIRGLTFSNIIIDDAVEMTAEQTAMIMSRKR